MNRIVTTSFARLVMLKLIFLLGSSVAQSQTPVFTYQGRLNDNGNPATGVYDLQFRLLDALVSGSQVGSTLVRDDVSVAVGIFSVTLDFGANAFPGANRFLEVGVRPGVSIGAFTILSPLQAITATPYALQSLNATTAANATQLGGVASSQYVLTGDSRLTDSRVPMAGSTNYIQNSAAPQSGSSFNISGNGTAGGTLSAGGVIGSSPLGKGVYGSSGGASSTTAGVFGENTASGGTGVVGNALNTNSAGVAGIADLSGGTGVYGRGATNGVSGNSTGGRGVFGGSASASSTNAGVWGENSVSGGTGVVGNALSANSAGVAGIADPSGGTGVYGRGTTNGVSGNSTNGRGVYGESASGSSTNAGIWGENSASGGTGVVGKALNTNSAGVAGIADLGGGTGVYGRGTTTGVSGNSTAGRGVYGGSATGSSTVAGVWGENSAIAGTGVVGNVTNVNGAGIAGIADPTGGTGVYARGAANGVSGNSTSGNGVYGGSNSGYGVFGQSTSSDGIYGTTDNVGSSGVYGQNFGTGCSSLYVCSVGVTGIGDWGIHGVTTGTLAGYFDGNVVITTDLFVAGSKHFKIDHPLNPAHKYLLHASIESPEVKNLYDGITTTDSNGDSTVTLPSYFEALNGDFRYQLTVLGQFAQAIVASEIADNQFTIKTDKPRVKVSWQVTGIRHDAYTKAHPMVVEPDKLGKEEGTYQHPELFGQPEERGLSWANDPVLMKRLKEEREARQRQQNNQTAVPATRLQ